MILMGSKFAYLSSALLASRLEFVAPLSSLPIFVLAVVPVAIPS